MKKNFDLAGNGLSTRFYHNLHRLPTTVLCTELELSEANVYTITFCSELRTGSLSLRFQPRVHSVHVYNVYNRTLVI